MDEECLRPGESTDMSLLEKMDKMLSSHNHYLSHKVANAATRKSLTRDVMKINLNKN